jgi:type I restriction enzyme R subunit
MSFTESNTVEAFIRDLLKSIGWTFVDRDTLPRQQQDVLVESHFREALVRLNPTIAERPERADEVLYPQVRRG